jgi:hypothetical protein
MGTCAAIGAAMRSVVFPSLIVAAATTACGANDPESSDFAPRDLRLHVEFVDEGDSIGVEAQLGPGPRTLDLGGEDSLTARAAAESRPMVRTFVDGLPGYVYRASFPKSAGPIEVLFARGDERLATVRAPAPVTPFELAKVDAIELGRPFTMRWSPVATAARHTSAIVGCGWLRIGGPRALEGDEPFDAVFVEKPSCPVSYLLRRTGASTTVPSLLRTTSTAAAHERRLPLSFGPARRDDRSR